MISLEKLPKENLYAFFDGSQYDGSEYWYDSINKVKATVKNGHIGKDGSVYLPFDEKKGFQSSISIPYNSYIPSSYSIYALLKVDKPKKISYPTNPPYQQFQLIWVTSNNRFFLIYFASNGNTNYTSDTTTMYCNLQNSVNYGVATTFPLEKYCLLTMNESTLKQTGFLNNKKLDDRKSSSGDKVPEGPILIGAEEPRFWTNMSVKAVLIYKEVKNEEQIKKVHNFFADSYNMPELFSEERLVAKISRLDNIAITAALEANYSRHKSFKQVVNSYRRGVGS